MRRWQQVLVEFAQHPRVERLGDRTGGDQGVDAVLPGFE
jgi:hypothetical protein